MRRVSSQVNEVRRSRSRGLPLEAEETLAEEHHSANFRVGWCIQHPAQRHPTSLVGVSPFEENGAHSSHTG